jgi:radical SAM superfamily enzyme YgiQ (UPF0313 family)
MGLLCIASPVLRAGYDVTLIDQRIQPGWKAALQRELENQPVCVGVSTSTGPQLRYALEASRLIKETSDVPVVWGGVHSTVLPEQTLESNWVDIVVHGEGEETFLELVQTLDPGKPLDTVRGIYFKNDGRILHSGRRAMIDLAHQPPPAFELLDPSASTRPCTDVGGADWIRIWPSNAFESSC